MEAEDKKISDIIDKIYFDLKTTDIIEDKLTSKYFENEDNWYEFHGIEEGEEVISEIEILCHRSGIQELLLHEYEDYEGEKVKINPFSADRTKEIIAGAELKRKEITLLLINLDEESQQSLTYDGRGDVCISKKITSLTGKSVIYSYFDWSGSHVDTFGFTSSLKDLRKILNKTYYLSS